MSQGVHGVCCRKYLRGTAGICRAHNPALGWMDGWMELSIFGVAFFSFAYVLPRRGVHTQPRSSVH